MKDISKSTAELAIKLAGINIAGGKCAAHLYHLERQGDSKKSRYIYRCKRPACHHYSTFSEIEGRKAQCRNCGDSFTIIPSLHLVKDSKATEMLLAFNEYVNCCNGEPKPIIKECNPFDFLEE